MLSDQISWSQALHHPRNRGKSRKETESVVSTTRFIFGLIGALALLIVPLAIAFRRPRRARANRRAAYDFAQKLRRHSGLYLGFAFFSAGIVALLAAYSDDGALLAAGVCLILVIALAGAVLRRHGVADAGATGRAKHRWEARPDWRREWTQESKRDAEPETKGAWKQPSHQAGHREWWDVIGVSREAPISEIKRIYRTRIKEFHPDRVTGLADEIVELAERRTKELNAAFAQAKAQQKSAQASPLRPRS